MATTVLTDCFISIDDTDVSAVTAKAALHVSVAAVDQTTMGAGTKIQQGGLKDWTASLEFVADESITGPLYDKIGTVVALELRASSDAVGATNPSYTGNALVTEFVPLDGSVGDSQRVTMTLVSAGPLTRAVA